MTPGVVDTDINADWISDPDARANAEELSVFNRIGRPGDVADLVVFSRRRSPAGPQARPSMSPGGSALSADLVCV